MASEQTTPTAPAVSSGATGDASDSRSGEAVSPATQVNWSAWSNLWQVPALALSVTLIAIGVFASFKPPAANDFDGALAQIQTMIAAGQLDDARTQLHGMVEPHLHLAAPHQQAQYHATLGDLLAATNLAQQSRDPLAWQPVAAAYHEAENLGLAMDVSRVERWATACLMLDDLEQARTRLDDLEEVEKVSKDGATVDLAHAGRNRLFRELVEATLRQKDVDESHVMQMLTEYRSDATLSAEDQLWAIARQAETHLHDGQPAKALEGLLVDIRRIESSLGSIPQPSAGELYTLLGQSALELGDYARAKNYLHRALEYFTGPEPARGDALVLLGRIAMVESDHAAALERFDLAVRDGTGTSAYLPALLGRAEVQSILGEHEQSLEDYESLRAALGSSRAHSQVTAGLMAQSLCNRHDAALSIGRLDTALQYLDIATSLFKQDRIPNDVLIRLASTHRQIADNLALSGGSARSDGEREMTPEQRQAVNDHYEKAGTFYLAHTSSQSDESIGEAHWFSSLWLAADSFDRGGRQDLAVRTFSRYLQASPMDDQRRADTLFRLGRAHHAQLNMDEAIRAYEQVLSESPRSTAAARVHVPLARCYLAANRRSEAEQQLLQVLSGDRLLTPDAADYRDALIELGTISYENDQFIAAIERFTEALERYPQDRRRLELQFRLADSYRANASTIEERLDQPPPLPPAEVNRLHTLKSEQLQKALELLAQVCDASESASGASRVHSDLENAMLRRAHFYRADCAYRLGQHETAIELYDRAARVYSTHASSMYALVQIVNCYSALGDAERAAAAHNRALVRLKQLPESTFDAQDSLMDRAAWERWLDSNPVGPADTAAASVSTDS